jgi:hypothetical protein
VEDQLAERRERDMPNLFPNGKEEAERHEAIFRARHPKARFEIKEV